MQAVEKKWRAIGYPMEEMPPGVVPIDFDLPHRERAAQMIKMAEAGVIGEPRPASEVDTSPEIQALFFDLIAALGRRRGRQRHARSPCSGSSPTPTPWHVVVDNGSTRAEPGEATDRRRDAGVAAGADFVEVGKGAVAPPGALLQRRLKLSGGPRNLLRFRKLFG